MSWIKQNKDAVARKSLVLRKTKLITEDDIEINDGWAKLKQEYVKYKDGTWDEKAQISLINAILYQQRAAFILTRKNFREILQNDKNWSKPMGLKNDKWSDFIYDSSELIHEVKKVQNGKAKVAIFCVKNPDLLATLCIDVKIQIDEVEKFIESNDLDAGDALGDQQGDTELERELELEGEINKSQTSSSKEMRNYSFPAEGEADQRETVNSQSPVEAKLIPNAPLKTTPITPEAILAKWKPSRVDSGDLDNQVAELFATLKHHSILKDELSTKKILKTMFGPSPSKKIQWLVDKAILAIEEQRELIYASSDIHMQNAPIDTPVAQGKTGLLRRKDFQTDEAYALWHDAFTSGREIHNLGGSVVEYYEQRVYASKFPLIK